jgi:hypothetical protein
VVRPGSIVLPLPFAQWGSSMLWQAETGFSFRMADGYLGALLPAAYGKDLGVPPVSAPVTQPSPARFARFLAARHVNTVLLDAANQSYWPQTLAAIGLRPREVGGVLVYRVPQSS